MIYPKCIIYIKYKKRSHILYPYSMCDRRPCQPQPPSPTDSASWAVATSTTSWQPRSWCRAAGTAVAAVTAATSAWPGSTSRSTASSPEAPTDPVTWVYFHFRQREPTGLVNRKTVGLRSPLRIWLGLRPCVQEFSGSNPDAVFGFSDHFFLHKKFSQPP